MNQILQTAVLVVIGSGKESNIYLKFLCLSLKHGHIKVLVKDMYKPFMVVFILLITF